jgi:translocation and assembly module TamB
LPDARLDFSLRGRGLAAGAFAWRQVEATLRGPARSPVATLALRDEEAPSVRSSASLQIGKRVDARDVRIALSRAGVDVSILAETVDVRDEVVDLGGLAIDGLGAPMDGVVRVGPRGFDVRLVSTAVDLGRLATLLGGRAPLSGTAALDVDVRNTESVSTGCIRLDARDARVGLMGGVDVSARARLAGSHVDVEANLAAGAQGPVEAAPAHEGACLPAAAVRSRALVSASVNADLALHGSPLRLASWTEARGTARLADVALDLDQIHGLLGLVRKIHPDLRGRVAATGELVRDRAGAPPSWALVARSRGLPPLLATGGAARDAAGADIAVTAVMDAEGALRAAACAGTAEAELADGHCSPHAAGVIAKVSAALRLDYERLAREPSSWKQVLLGSRGEARVQVGRHDLARLLAPVFVGSPLPFDARLESADLAVTGTPRDPRIALVASASRPIVLGDPIPVRVELRADYDAARGGGSWVATLEREGAGARDAALPEACIAPRRSEARRPGSRRAHATMAVAQGDVRVRWQDVLAALAGEQGPPGWEVNANVPVEQVHLSDVPMLADADICGVMTGHGWVRGLGRDPHIGLEMSFDQLRVGDGFVYDTGRVAIESRGAGIGGSLSLEAHAPGTRKLISSLSGSFDAPRVRWAHGLVPNVDERHPVRVAVSADRLRAAALQPLVTPVLSYLEGDISGSVEVSVAPGRGASHVEKVDLTLDNGALQIPTLGQELMGISGKARTVARDSVAVDGLRASALSGSLAAAARISFRDLAVYGVSASVATNERNRVRLTLEGVPLGDLYGQAFAVLERPEGLNDVRVELRGVHVDLSDSDTRKVQELGLNPDIAVVPTPESLRAYWVRRAHRGGSDQGASAWESHAPSSPVRAASPWQVSLRLRDPLQVQRAGMRFGVVTPPDARDLPTLVYPEATTGRLAMRGFVGLDGGRIDVFGKRFDVEPERARVSFLGEPGNPALAVTAHWDAPDGTRVFADVTGTLKEPHVQLRSDPAKPQNEILAMILFGTSGSGQATASGQPAGAGGGQAAAGVGGGVAAAGINRILEDVSPVNVSTRVDTSRSSNVRPTLVVEVSRNVFAEATVNTGVAALGQNPDRYMLTLDWRVSRAWSVRTTVGDAGSSILDVLWLHRY